MYRNAIVITVMDILDFADSLAPSMATFYGADTVVCFREAWWSSLLGWLATNPRVVLFL